jgi:GTPase Era involved in 16S rRNA processing
LKKNGKKYRRIQREKELKKAKNGQAIKPIEQEVDGMDISFLSISHIVVDNPIMREQEAVKNEYLERLAVYLKAGKWNRRKYERAELSAYEKIILGSEEFGEEHDISYYKYYILLDIMHMLGYEIKASDEPKLELVKTKYYEDFQNCGIDKGFVNKLFWAFQGKGKDKYNKLQTLSKSKVIGEEKQYIQLILNNLHFKDQRPAGIMVTATMSAGKSTFINALTGKYICLSQNMACTNKIHSIVNKAYEDGYAYEYDHDLVLTAGKEELFNNNTLNTSDKIVVGVHFDGGLKDHRIIIHDSPGVNFSGDQEHKLITDKLLRGKNYHLLVYVMNATQLGTNDESDHLDFVRRTIGRTPVIFVVNKIDSFNVEEENIEAALTRQIEFLKKKGFKNPIVCPVSARAGYLSKRFEDTGLSRTEERELYNFVDKFDQMGLVAYYEKCFKKIRVDDAGSEEEQLQKICGLAYVEKIIGEMTTGGK